VEFYRFADLKARGIVSNRVTLHRWTLQHGFPRHVQLGPNSVAWIRGEIEAWLENRAAERDVKFIADESQSTGGSVVAEPQTAVNESEAKAAEQDVSIPIPIRRGMSPRHAMTRLR
jgi:hypothetical protein